MAFKKTVFQTPVLIYKWRLFSHESLPIFSRNKTHPKELMEFSQTLQTKFITLILKHSPLPNDAALHPEPSPGLLARSHRHLSPSPWSQLPCVLTISSIVFTWAQSPHNSHLTWAMAPPVSLNSPVHSRDCGVFHEETQSSSPPWQLGSGIPPRLPWPSGCPRLAALHRLITGRGDLALHYPTPAWRQGLGLTHLAYGNLIKVCKMKERC